MRTLLAATWFAIALWFLLPGGGPESYEYGDTPPRVKVPAEAIAPRPLRRSLGDPPVVDVGGFEKKCSDCHELFETRDADPGTLLQHTEIVLDHGLNDRCLNCHSREDHDELVTYDGTVVGYADSTRLCSKCHGTTFRDWERGVHGRTMGSWDASSGEQYRLRCVDCHDPHSPAFDPIETLPAPRVRGYRPPGEHHAQENKNPLERWKYLEPKGEHSRE